MGHGHGHTRPPRGWSCVAASSAPINWPQAGGLELRTAPCFDCLRSLDSGFTYVQKRVRVFAKKQDCSYAYRETCRPLSPPSPSSFAAVCPKKMHQGPDRADIVDSCASSAFVKNKIRRIGTELALRIGARRACQDSGDRGAACSQPYRRAVTGWIDRGPWRNDGQVLITNANALSPRGGGGTKFTCMCRPVVGALLVAWQSVPT